MPCFENHPTVYSTPNREGLQKIAYLFQIALLETEKGLLLLFSLYSPGTPVYRTRQMFLLIENKSSVHLEDITYSEVSHLSFFHSFSSTHAHAVEHESELLYHLLSLPNIVFRSLLRYSETDVIYVIRISFKLMFSSP